VVRVQAQPTSAKALSVKYNFRNIDNNNGLNSNDVNAITQDRNGYIWIGTEKGLQRYDGLRFMDCFSSAGKIGSQTVYTLYPDDTHGRIYYNQPDNRLRHWSFLTNTSTEIKPEALPPIRTAAIYQDGNKRKWSITEYWRDSSKREGGEQGLALISEVGNSWYRQVRFIKDEQRNQTWLVDSANALLLLNDLTKTISTSQCNPGTIPYWPV
jgi:hypothetical protein